MKSQKYFLPVEPLDNDQKLVEIRINLLDDILKAIVSEIEIQEKKFSFSVLERHQHLKKILYYVIKKNGDDLSQNVHHEKIINKILSITLEVMKTM